MKRAFWRRSGVAMLSLFVALVLSACGDFEGFDDDGGGGGGTDVTFQQGFVFTRRTDADDHVFIADKSNYQLVRRLAGDSSYRQPSLSKDGKSAVFVQVGSAATSIQIVAVNGGATPTTVFTSDGAKTNFRTPVFSPDGALIVFAYDEGGTSKIGKVSATGQDFSELTGGPTSKASPSFFPDGLSVLVMGGSSSANYTQLERLTLSGGSQTVLNNLGSNEAAAIQNRLVLSPDGTKATFDALTSSSQKRIFVFDMAAKTSAQVSDTGVGSNDTFPSWVGSTQVAFASDSGGSNQVYVVSAAGPKDSGTLTVPTASEPWFGP